MVAAIMFSSKDIISSFNTVYGIDISIIGLVGAAAMAGRIVGTLLEKRLNHSCLCWGTMVAINYGTPS